jgi:alpha-1,2-mannosyltransferase
MTTASARAMPATSGSPLRLLALFGVLVLVSLVAVELVFRLTAQPPPHGDFSAWLFHPERALDDSWGPMNMAYRWLRGPHEGTIYQQIFFAQHVKYQYPPTALLPIAALDLGGIEPSVTLLNAIGRFSVCVIALANAVLAAMLASRVAPAAGGMAARMLLVAVTAVATVLFYPVMRAYNIGQIQTVIDAAFLLACLCWLIGQRFGTGMLIGAICLLKPQFGLFLVWGLLRRQRSFVIGWCAVFGIGLAVSIALFGLDNHLDYLTVLQFLSRHGEGFFGNQSVNGLLNRWFFPETRAPFAFHDFPPYQPLIYIGTMLSSVLLVLAALFVRGRYADRGGLLDFLAAALTFTIASPIAWDHHYGVLAPIFVSLLFGILALPQASARWRLLALLGIAYLLSATFVRFGDMTSGAWLDPLESYLLFAGLASLWLLYRVPAPLGFAAPVGGAAVGRA